MSDCPHVSQIQWNLGESGYLDMPISKHYESILKKESEFAAKARAADDERHRKDHPEQYTAEGVRIKNW
jgi:hypothetical protein